MIFLSLIKQSEQQVFAAKLTKIAAVLGIPPDHLMAVFYKESKLKPTAYNESSGASGIMQWMPRTATWLGTSTGKILTMSATQQLDYVQAYFQKLNLAGKLHDYTDVYLAVFFPAALGKPENWVLQTNSTNAEKIALSNPAIDLNKDHQITVSEFREYARKKMPSEALEALKKTAPFSAGALLIAAVVAYFIVKRQKPVKL